MYTPDRAINPPSFYEDEQPEVETVVCEYCGEHHNKEYSNSLTEDWDVDGMVDVWVCDNCLHRYRKSK